MCSNFTSNGYLSCWESAEFWIWGLGLGFVNTNERMGMALIWVVVVLLSYNNNNVSEATETDIQCLKSIKDSLEDPNDYLSFSWNFNNKTEGYICKFAGIECWHPDENRVLNIDLSDMGLKGQFPTGIRNCTSLTGLDLSNNKLSGSIPSDISSILHFVTSLILSSNSFTGLIPPSLANCTYLNFLELDNNRFNGSIPLELSLLGRLKTFSVANNLLTGQIPKFPNATIHRDNYANNPGLCGRPIFDPCQGSPKKSHTGVIAGAAVGGVAVTLVVVVIILHYISQGVVIKKKKKDDDPDGNKWTKSIKGLKGLKASFSLTKKVIFLFLFSLIWTSFPCYSFLLCRTFF